MFLSLVLQDYRIPVCAQLLVMIVIAARLSLLGFVFKPVSWLAGDSRLRQTFCLRIHMVEQQSLSSICPSTIISYLRSLGASLSTSASRSIAGPIVFSLDRNKPVTAGVALAVTVREMAPRGLTVAEKPRGRRQLESRRIRAAMSGRWRRWRKRLGEGKGSGEEQRNIIGHLEGRVAPF